MRCALLLFLLLGLGAFLPAQDAPATSEASKAGPKKTYFWFRMWPDYLVKFDPSTDKEVARVRSKHGVAHGTYLAHDKKRFLLLTGQRSMVEEIDIARMETVEEHSFKEDGYIVRVQTVKEIPGGKQWYVQLRRIKNNLDHYTLLDREWVLYDLEDQEIKKRMKELPEAIRRGSRISPCGTKWHVFSGDLKIVDPKTFKTEATIDLTTPRYTGTSALSVRGTDLFQHENTEAYRLVYTTRDPVKRDRTMFGLLDISLKENKVSKITEWGWSPPVSGWRLSRNGLKAMASVGRRGRSNLAGDPQITLVGWDMGSGKKLLEKTVPSRNGLRFVGLSPDGKKAYLAGRGHELVIFDENLDHLRTVEMSGELDGQLFVVDE